MKKNILILFGLLFFISAANAQNAPGSDMFKASFAPLVYKVLPTVVSIEAEKKYPSPLSQVTVTSDNPTLRDYFLYDDGGKISQGSGFIIDNKGNIVTNYHVVKGCDNITVKLSNGSPFEAKLIGGDEATDLAVLQIHVSRPLPFAEMGDSDSLKLGDFVLTAGNSFGLGISFSTGIVSAKSRDIDMGVYDNFIQTDAAINQGSSGGPMFNMDGKVVGINTALYSPTGESVGVGFATPINLSRFVISRLLEKGQVDRSWIGVKVANQTDTIRISDNQKFFGGVSVVSITNGSPAQIAKLEAGDVILAINGSDVTNIKDFSRRIAEMPIGRDIILRIWRSDKVEDITLRTALRPEPKVEDKKKDKLSEDSYIPSLGIAFGVSGSTVFIRDVLKNSQAYERGIRAGDLVQKINFQPVSSISDALSYIDYAKDGAIQMNIISYGKEHNINLETKAQ